MRGKIIQETASTEDTEDTSSRQYQKKLTTRHPTSLKGQKEGDLGVPKRQHIKRMGKQTVILTHASAVP